MRANRTLGFARPLGTPCRQQSYNEERPHEALAMKTLAEVYELSPRPLPSSLPEHAYALAERRSERSQVSVATGVPTAMLVRRGARHS